MSGAKSTLEQQKGKTLSYINKMLLALFGYCMVSMSLQAQQSGMPDSAFSFDGKTNFPINSIQGWGYAVAVQPDGKIVVGGRASDSVKHNFALARLNTDGSFDNSFANGGKLMISLTTGDHEISDLLIEEGGKIIAAGRAEIAGNYDFAVACFNSDGTLDSSFATNGYGFYQASPFDEQLYSITPDSSNGFILNGLFHLARLDSDGNLDLTFGINGFLSYPSLFFETTAILSDSTFIAAGSETIGNMDMLLAKLKNNGDLDSAFGSSGIISHDLGSTLEAIIDVKIQPDGKIVAGAMVDFFGGGSEWDFVVARYNPDGTPDSSFNGTGIYIHQLPGRQVISGIVIQPDGKIVAAGSSGGTGFVDFFMIRLDVNGTLDLNFGNSGSVLTDFNADNDAAFDIALQADNKIVLAGMTYINMRWQFAVARYTNQLVSDIDQYQEEKGLSIFPNPFAESLTLNYIVTDQDVGVNIYDLHGRCIRTILPDKVQSKGYYSKEIFFEKNIQPGLYIIELKSTTATVRKKAMKIF